MAAHKPTQTIVLLQVLRALAAILVLVGHAGHDGEAIANRLGLPALRMDFVDWGFGVHLFFVISGFIMVLTAADDFGRPGAWRAFLRRRIERVVPLYWALTTALIVIAVLAPRLLNVPVEDWRSVLASYLFIPYPRGNGEIRPVMALGWTLNYEMFFYALFAVATFMPLRRGIAALTAFMIGLVALGQLVPLTSVQLRAWTSPIILEFVIGALLALAYRRGWRIPLAASIALALSAIGILLLSPLRGTDAADLATIAATGLPALMLVTAAALLPPPSPAGRPWLQTLVLLGDASYSLYLFHPFVVRPFREIWIFAIGDRLSVAGYVVACSLAAILCAVACHLFVEKPLTRMVRAIGSASRSRVVAARIQAVVARR